MLPAAMIPTVQTISARAVACSSTTILSATPLVCASSTAASYRRFNASRWLPAWRTFILPWYCPHLRHSSSAIFKTAGHAKFTHRMAHFRPIETKGCAHCAVPSLADQYHLSASAQSASHRHGNLSARHGIGTLRNPPTRNLTQWHVDTPPLFLVTEALGVGCGRASAPALAGARPRAWALHTARGRAAMFQSFRTSTKLLILCGAFLISIAVP